MADTGVLKTPAERRVSSTLTLVTMVRPSIKERARQLGMSHGTATYKLRKMLLFALAQRCDLDTCFQCNEKITSIDDFSVEHKIPWLHSKDPAGLFFDLDNIAFSHLSCNCKATRQVRTQHPSRRSYRKGCRCDECTQLNREYQRDWKRQKRLWQTQTTLTNGHE